eukprot:scaffold2970_cov36-Cyclotella_meneghiniana.AAC.4
MEKGCLAANASSNDVRQRRSRRRRTTGGKTTINRRFDSPENRELTAFTVTIRRAGGHVQGPERESNGGFTGRQSAKPRPTPKQNRSNDIYYPGTAGDQPGEAR